MTKERCLLVGCVLRGLADPWFVCRVFALLLVVADHSALAVGSRQQAVPHLACPLHSY